MSENHTAPVNVSSSLSSSMTSMASDELPNYVEELEFDFGMYIGEVDPITGLRSGQGELRYKNGNVYRGAWLDGAPHGYGEKVYANGDIYRGSWRSGKRCGKGGYLYSLGHYFEGQYYDDLPHGYGVLNTLQGDCYTGQWFRGKKHGRGKENLADGTCYTGQWREGRKCGNGVMYLPGGQGSIRGIWRGDCYIGEAPEVDKSGDDKSAFRRNKAVRRDVSPTGNVESHGDMADVSTDSMDLSAVSISITKKASEDLSELEMRLEALVAAMANAGIPDNT